MDYRVPARGLVGFRTEFMTDSCGTGMLHHVLGGWEPWHNDLKTKRDGSMVADRRGVTTCYTVTTLQDILSVGRTSFRSGRAPTSTRTWWSTSAAT